jgi:hypothetical protein
MLFSNAVHHGLGITLTTNNVVAKFGLNHTEQFAKFGDIPAAMQADLAAPETSLEFWPPDELPCRLHACQPDS